MSTTTNSTILFTCFGVSREAIQRGGATVEARLAELASVQCIFENYVHATSRVDHNPRDPVVGHLNRDYHRVVVGLDRVVSVILCENDLSRAGGT